jgi:hypothetical protein
VTYDLLFRWWSRHEIERIVSEIPTTLTAADDCYVHIAKLCKIVSLVNYHQLPSIRPFPSSFGRVDSHDQLRELFFKIENMADGVLLFLEFLSGNIYFQYLILKTRILLASVPGFVVSSHLALEASFR